MRRALAFGAVALSIECAAAQPPPDSCEAIGPAQSLAAIPEASGIALAGGALWLHNDSGAPVLFRIDPSGRETPISVAAAEVRDWEDLAVGNCATGACLYIADIGDNQDARDRITIYKVSLPESGSTSTPPAEAFHAVYPDSPHDAEALVMTRSAGAFIVTKETPPRVYRFETGQRPGQTATLAFVRTLDEKIRITGGAVSPDDRWVALRSNTSLLLYTLGAFLKTGNAVRVDLSAFNEPQGEGIAFGNGGELYLVSEGGRKNAAGSLTRVRCALLQ